MFGVHEARGKPRDRTQAREKLRFGRCGTPVRREERDVCLE